MSERESLFADRRLPDGSRYISQAGDLPLNRWRKYRKKVPVSAQPITGPLVVKTREGEYTLPADWRGWIALDSGGYPYPIVDEEFDAMYEAVDA